ncbi:hypothetical protein ACIBF1_14910 [Spirillospora sp. NPDC050679]
MPLCPGPCNNPRRPRRPASGPPTPGDPVWCGRCQVLLRARLAELDDLAAKLAASPETQGSGRSERVSGSRSRPSPSPAVDDLDELLRTLLGWEDAYREHRSFAPRPRRGRYAATLASCVAWLGAHLDGLLVFPGAADFGLEVMEMHRRLRSRTSSPAPRRRAPEPCPECDLLTLVHNPATDEVRCRACNWTATSPGLGQAS